MLQPVRKCTHLNPWACQHASCQLRPATTAQADACMRWQVISSMGCGACLLTLLVTTLPLSHKCMSVAFGRDMSPGGADQVLFCLCHNQSLSSGVHAPNARSGKHLDSPAQLQQPQQPPLPARRNKASMCFHDQVVLFILAPVAHI